jgi:hypothetical protein
VIKITLPVFFRFFLQIMKIKLSHSQLRIFWFGFILLIFGSISVFSQEKFSVKNTEVILITATSADGHDKPNPVGNEALLITNESEIAKFVKLFDGNRKSMMHACGYHWRITFIRKSAEPLDVWFNQKCEEFEFNTAEICETVQSKFSEIKNSPTHFVTEVEIDVNTNPDDAIGKINKNPNYTAFVLGDLDNRLPFIEIESKAVSEIPEDRNLWNKAQENTRLTAEKILTEESKWLSQKFAFAVLKNGRIRRSMSMFGGGEIEENQKMKIYFQIGTNIENIEKSLTNTKFLGKAEPKIYYLQIISKNRFSESFREQLTKEFPFIKQVLVYTSYPR